MTKLEYQYAKGRLVGVTESLNELSFKNKKEAMKILSDRMLYLSVSLQGITVHDEVAELKARLAKLGESYDSLVIDNTLLQTIFSEIKKHQTAGNALRFAIARVKELEDLLELQTKKQEDDES